MQQVRYDKQTVQIIYILTNSLGEDNSRFSQLEYINAQLLLYDTCPAENPSLHPWFKLSTFQFLVGRVLAGALGFFGVFGCFFVTDAFGRGCLTALAFGVFFSDALARVLV